MEPELNSGVNIEQASADIAADLGFGQGDNEQDEVQLDAEAPEGDVSHETPAAPDAPTPETEIPMPKSWAKDREELWAQTPKPVREQIMAREKQMLDGLDMYKEHNEFGRKIKEIATPYDGYLKSQGVAPDQAFSYLLAAQHRLATGDQATKVEMLSQLARSVGVDLGQITQNTPQNPQNPELSPLLDEIKGIKSELSARKQAEFQQFRQQNEQEVNAFAEDPKNAYFDECADETAKFIKAGYGLKEAYEKAVWANPVTREKELARIRTEAQQNLKTKSKEETQKVAKATSSNVRSRDTGKAPTEPLGSWDDTMKETLSTIRSRTH